MGHFQSLDDLVVFGMAHELKVAGEEVHLNDAVACRDVAGPHLLTPLCGGIDNTTCVVHSSLLPHLCCTGQRGRLPEKDDNDLLTDLFASVFGAHCAVSHQNATYTPAMSCSWYTGAGCCPQQPEV